MIKKKLLYLKLIFTFIILVVNGKVPKKILGGKSVSIDKINYQASLQINNVHICSGVILSRHHILTSATCVILENSITLANIKIRIGSNDLLDDHSPYVSYFDVFLVAIHPKFDVYNFWANDICILKLTTKITIDGKNVGIGKLFRDDEQIKNRLRVSGWSKQPSDNTVNYQYILKKIQITRPRKPECIFIYDAVMRKNQYCAYGMPKTARVTWGDGGGPVSEFRKIYGIVSISLITEDSTFLYTKILAYQEWINQIMAVY